MPLKRFTFMQKSVHYFGLKINPFIALLLKDTMLADSLHLPDHAQSADGQ